MYNPDKISIRRRFPFGLKTISVFFLITFFATQQPLAQLTDDFSDGDFITNPEWNGSSGHFIVNGSYQLQLNNNLAGTSYLSTALSLSSLIDNYEWEFSVKQSFAPSGGNFSRFYLLSDQPDLAGLLNGYYLQFGEAGSNDAVELFRQSGSTSISVCRAGAGKIAGPFQIRVKVNRNISGLWELFVDYSGGRDFVLEATGTEIIHNSSAFSGVLCTYTVTNAARFYFDDVIVRSTKLVDTFPPEVVSLEIQSDNKLNIVFTEKMDVSSTENISNYFISTDVQPESARLLADQKTLQLVFSKPFQNGLMNTLTILSVEDTAGNKMLRKEIDFRYFIPYPVSFGDIIISEVFPDPSPQVGLPASEFVELYNRSLNPIELAGWRFSDGSSTGFLPSCILLPDGYVILSPSSGLSLFQPHGQTISVSNFPTLNNASDRIVLTDSEGAMMDSVHYSDAWYKDEDKQSGGWTLERIDPENDCHSEANWMASKDISGGTPGKINSVHQITPDKRGPHLLEAIQMNNTTLQLVFDETLNRSIPIPENFAIEPFIGIMFVSFADFSHRRITLELSDKVDSTHIYTITALNILDCPGNLIEAGFEKVYLNKDLIPPFIYSVKAETAHTLSVIFSEKVTRGTAGILTSYRINTLGHPVSVTFKDEGRSVVLDYAQPFQNGKDLSVFIKDVADSSGNIMTEVEKSFLYFQAMAVRFKDVIITEFFADPTPQVGLPDAEFVEIYNRSENPFDLSGWILTDGTTEGKLPSMILLPGNYLIVTSSNAQSQFSSFGQTVSTSPFPGLNNSSDFILLKEGNGNPVDSIRYNLSWYRDNEKAEGGWSMELIDPENVCEVGSNWQASESEAGGTPGNQNSVYANKPDSRGPKLQSVTALNSLTLLITFDEKLENVTLDPQRFSIDPPLMIHAGWFGDATLSTIILSLSEELGAGTRYTLTVNEIYDCPGNSIDLNFSRATFILPEKAEAGDIIINEILFNPRSTGVDFVELYNRSEKTIDLKQWKISQFNNGVIDHLEVITDETLLISPNEYKVFTENIDILKGEYLQGVEDAFVQMSLPPFNDDAGSVAILNEEEELMDTFAYTDKMHAVFIQRTEGVSLERISFDIEAEHVQNWRSASSSVGFATPGYVNSNLRGEIAINDESIIVEPGIFQPQVYNHDFTLIKFRFDHGGFVANVHIFDPQGRRVKAVAQNALLGTTGFFRWEGDLDNGSMARRGSYLVWFEVFDDKGVVKTYKKRVVVY